MKIKEWMRESKGTDNETQRSGVETTDTKILSKLD